MVKNYLDKNKLKKLSLDELEEKIAHIYFDFNESLKYINDEILFFKRIKSSIENEKIILRTCNSVKYIYITLTECYMCISKIICFKLKEFNNYDDMNSYIFKDSYIVERLNNFIKNRHCLAHSLSPISDKIIKQSDITFLSDCFEQLIEFCCYNVLLNKNKYSEWKNLYKFNN